MSVFKGFLLTLLLLLFAPFFLGLLTIADYMMLLLIAAGLLVQAFYLHPYIKWHKKEVPDFEGADYQAHIKLMISNVLMSNNQHASLLSLVKEQNPDVLLCMETNQEWHQAIKSLCDDYPYQVCEPNEKMYGMHVFSKLPVSDVQVEHLVQSYVPSIHLCLDLKGARVWTHFMHPAPPSPSENEESTERDAELLALARKLSDITEPTIMIGDLNDVPWSKPLRAFKRISNMNDVRVGRAYLNTFHAAIPFLRWPLDHVFVSRHFQLIELKRHRLTGSDHFSVTAELALMTDETLEEDKPTKDSDFSYASEVMDNKNISQHDVPK